MTQVVACLTRDFVALGADRRLINLATGELIDDEAAKLVVAGRQLAFAYTGLANLRAGEKGQTDLWMVNQFTPVPHRLPDFFRILEERATEAFGKIAHLGPKAKRHAFVSVGWQPTNSGEFEPFALTCSNALDDQGEWRNYPERAFTNRYTTLGDQDVEFMSFGQPWDDTTRGWLDSEISARGPLAASDGLALIAAVIRRTAVNNKAVGRGLQAVVLPKTTVSSTGGFQLQAPGPVPDPVDGLVVPEVAEPAAVYLPSDSNTGELYAPHYVDQAVSIMGATVHNRALGPDEIRQRYEEGLKRLKDAE